MRALKLLKLGGLAEGLCRGMTHTSEEAVLGGSSLMGAVRWFNEC